MGYTREINYEEVIKQFPNDTTLQKYGADLARATTQLITSPKTTPMELDPTFQKRFKDCIDRMGIYLSVYVSAGVINQLEAMCVIKNFTIITWDNLKDKYSREGDAPNDNG